MVERLRGPSAERPRAAGRDKPEPPRIGGDLRTAATSFSERRRIAERPMVRWSAAWRVCVALLPFMTACGSTVRSAAPAASPVPPVVAHVESVERPPVPVPPPPVEDPVVTLIATSDQHFKAGERELQLGHDAAAKQQFDKAVSVLLE